MPPLRPPVAAASAALFALTLPALACTADDACEELCTKTSASLAGCLAEWPVTWEELDATSRQNFRKACDNRWAGERSDLEPGELDDALEQCEEAADVMEALDAQGELCDHLRTLYLID